MRHEDMDKVALDRYKVVKSKATLWPCSVVAGDGSQELFSGSESTCNHVARKLIGAFLDGAFYAHSQHQKGLEVDKTLKSFFESDVFTSLDEPQKLSVATVMRAMYEAMQRENDKPKNKGEAHSCDIPGCAVCDPCYGL